MITLRLNFSKDVSRPTAEIHVTIVQVEGEVKDDYRIQISNHHILFFITITKRKYYSPHLHIELTENNDKTTNVIGLYLLDHPFRHF
jgi:hypothetical protein